MKCKSLEATTHNNMYASFKLFIIFNIKENLNDAYISIGGHFLPGICSNLGYEGQE